MRIRVEIIFLKINSPSEYYMNLSIPNTLFWSVVCFNRIFSSKVPTTLFLLRLDFCVQHMYIWQILTKIIFLPTKTVRMILNAKNVIQLYWLSHTKHLLTSPSSYSLTRLI
jgi:hypothetical protein